MKQYLVGRLDDLFQRRNHLPHFDLNYRVLQLEIFAMSSIFLNTLSFSETLVLFLNPSLLNQSHDGYNLSSNSQDPPYKISHRSLFTHAMHNAKPLNQTANLELDFQQLNC